MSLFGIMRTLELITLINNQANFFDWTEKGKDLKISDMTILLLEHIDKKKLKEEKQVDQIEDIEHEEVQFALPAVIEQPTEEDNELDDIEWAVIRLGLDYVITNENEIYVKLAEKIKTKIA